MKSLDAKTLLMLAMAALFGMAASLSARPAGAAWSNHPTQGVPVCAATGAQDSVQICADNVGGTFVVWVDRRGGNADIYATHLTPSGAPYPGIGTDGAVVCNATGDQKEPAIVPDGAGGAIIVWSDPRANGVATDIYAQRLNAANTPLWGANGVAVCTQPNSQETPVLVADGVGGALVAWLDRRNGAASSDIFAIRLKGSDGTASPGWTPQGVAVCNAAGLQTRPAAVPDGSAGVIIAWLDRRGASPDIYAQHLTLQGVPTWTTNGLVVCNDDSTQGRPAIASDSDGGAIIVWEDGRAAGSTTDVFAQRIHSLGIAAWPTNGIPVGSGVGNQYGPLVIPDGVGGAIIGWTDGRSASDDIYGQRLTAGGAAAWTPNGVAVTTAAGAQVLSAMAPDCGVVPGAFFVWEDARNPTADIYAGRLRISGNAPNCWNNGVPVLTAVGSQLRPAITSDGDDGAVIVAVDSRRLHGLLVPDITAQRLDCRLGLLGDPSPSNVTAHDVPNDNGGRILVSWSASFLDTPEPTFTTDCVCAEVAEYRVWRQVAPGHVTAMLARGEGHRIGSTDPLGGPGRYFRTSQSGAQTVFWELAATQPAYGFPGYSLVISTPYDSVAGSNPGVLVMVQALTPRAAAPSPVTELDPAGIDRRPIDSKEIEANEDCEAEWHSDTTGTSSVDNQAPAPPFPFAGEYVTGSVRLHWRGNLEPDLYRYNLYRGTTETFIPSAANLLAVLADTSYTDPLADTYSYKLSAIDTHQNESGFTLLRYREIAAAPPENAPPVVWQAPAAPNPFLGATTIQFGLPHPGHAVLTVYDVTGRRVRRLVDRAFEAGAQSATWDGRDDDGTVVGSGLYFYRLEVGGQVLVGRVAALR